MTAMIWKEVREHGMWAVLALLAVALGMVYVLPRVWQDFYDPPLCSPAFLLLTTFASALGGFLLGLLQTLPETRRDRWAFLVHRPVSPTRLFLGKVVAGLMLYLPALGLPLLGATLWVATPGHVAVPFDAHTMLPGVADALGGIVFYFAGLLAGLRPVRWYGSRVLGVAFAVACAAFVTIVPEFWHALFIILGSGAVLATAAWGSFLTAGAYDPQPRAAKVALGLSTMVGLMVASLLGFAFLASTGLWEDSDGAWVSYHVDHDGNLLCVTRTRAGVTSVTDIAGRPVQKYADPEARAALVSYWPAQASLDLAGEQASHYRVAQRYAWYVIGTDDASWYFVPAEGRVRGYSRRDRRCVGSLGPEGFCPPGATAADRFQGPCLSVGAMGLGVVAFPGALYVVDGTARQVQRLFTPEPGEAVIGAAALRIGEFKKLDWQVVVATRASLHIVLLSGEPLLTLPCQYDPETYSHVSVLAPGGRDHYLVWYTPSTAAQSLNQWTLPGWVAEYSRDGQELRRKALPPLSNAPPGWIDVAPAAVVPLIGFISTVLFYALLAAMGQSAGIVGLADLRCEWARTPAGLSILGGALFLISAAACAAIAIACARRYAFTARARRWWALAAFFGGPAALLTLVALRDWPARMACPACGRSRVVTREHCEHCGGALPPPATDGTEILEG